MEPLTAGLILGAAQGLSSLYGLSAQQEAEKRRMEQEALTGAYQMKRKAMGEGLERQQSALGDLIAAYRSSMGVK